jgi:hypothetical protein
MARDKYSISANKISENLFRYNKREDMSMGDDTESLAVSRAVVVKLVLCRYSING